jgi:hypothetical protein
VGQQVNFFWYGPDEVNFIEAARQRSGDLCVLRYMSASKPFEPISELPPIDELGGFHVWLWDRLACSAPVVQWVEQQRYYTVDPSASEVIELSRSYEREGNLVRGRLWAELTGWKVEAPNERFEKSVAFQKWFKSLAGWIKNNYTKTPEGWYLGPEAEKFRERGGRLSGADFAPVVKIVKH